MIRAVLFGTYTAAHPANRLLAAVFRSAGIAVDVCHEPLWERTRDKTAAFFGVRSLARLGVAYLGAAMRLAPPLSRADRQPDLVVTGFNGQLDVPLARLVAGRRARLVFAPLVTLTETLVEDRHVYRRSGMQGRAARRLDRLTLEWPDLVLTDTETHRTWIADELTPRARTATLYLGAEPPFRPTRRAAPAGEPLGCSSMAVRSAAWHGRDRRGGGAPRAEGGVEITMIGTGPERERRATRGGARRERSRVRGLGRLRGPAGAARRL
jgi:hypothetical protein